MLLRYVPLSNDLYAVPVVVWILSLCLSRVLPSSFIRALPLRFPLVPSFPTIDPADMDLPENVEVLAAAMAAAAGASGTQSPSQQSGSADSIWLSASGAQRRRYFMSLLRYPFRLLAYWKNILMVREDGDHCLLSQGGGYGGRVFASLLRCFTALCVQATRHSFAASVMSYMTVLSVRKRRPFRREAAGDLIGATLGAMIANGFMLLYVKALNKEGQWAPTRAAVVGNRPVLHWIKYILLPSLRIALLLSQMSSFTFHFGPRGGDPMDGSGSGSRSRENTEEGDGTRDDLANSSDAVRLDEDHQGHGRARNGRDYAAEAWARSAGAVQVTASRELSQPLPPVAYLCGGECFSYAFSGFCFVYRQEWVQLRVSSWSYLMDSFHTRLNLWLLRGTTGMTAADEGTSSGSLLSLVSTGDNGLTAVDPATGDVYFTAASSEDLNLCYLVSFLCGCAVGAAATQGPLALRVARRVPLLSSVVNVLLPPPLEAIDIPERLMEATLTDAGVMRVYRHDHLTPSNPRSGGQDDTQETVDNESFVDIPLPPECFCPITRSLMKDPVKTEDGFTYDREAITAWLQRRETSPLTNLPLRKATLVSNTDVHAQVTEAVRLYNQFVARHHHQPQGEES